jgi:hypothetical protein
VAASSDPQALVNARSFAISEALGELYKLSYGRTEAVSSMDVIEMLYSKGLLTSDHYQDILIRHNKFRPQSDD